MGEHDSLMPLDGFRWHKYQAQEVAEGIKKNGYGNHVVIEVLITQVASSSEAPTVKEEEVGKEASEGSESKDAIIKRFYDALSQWYNFFDKDILGWEKGEPTIHNGILFSNLLDLTRECLCLGKLPPTTSLPMGVNSERNDNSQSYPKSASACSSEATKWEEPDWKAEYYELKNIMNGLRKEYTDIQENLTIANQKIEELERSAPTQWAYDQVCKANEDKRIKLSKAIEALEKYADEKEWYQGGTFDMEYCYKGPGHILARDALKEIK